MSFPRHLPHSAFRPRAVIPQLSSDESPSQSSAKSKNAFVALTKFLWTLRSGLYRTQNEHLFEHHVGQMKSWCDRKRFSVWSRKILKIVMTPERFLPITEISNSQDDIHLQTSKTLQLNSTWRAPIHHLPFFVHKPAALSVVALFFLRAWYSVLNRGSWMSQMETHQAAKVGHLSTWYTDVSMNGVRVDGYEEDGGLDFTSVPPSFCSMCTITPYCLFSLYRANWR